jgi:hypothetical protein
MLNTRNDVPATLTWLLAQYDEIETAAREAGEDDAPSWELRDGRIMGADPRYHSVIIDHSAEPTPGQRRHIVLNDPVTVLADIAAKRDIIADLTEDSSPEGRQRASRTIRHLASAFAHRPAGLME